MNQIIIITILFYNCLVFIWHSDFAAHSKRQKNRTQSSCLYRFISPGSVNPYKSMSYLEAHDFNNQFSVYLSSPYASTLRIQWAAWTGQSECFFSPYLLYYFALLIPLFWYLFCVSYFIFCQPISWKLPVFEAIVDTAVL